MRAIPGLAVTFAALTAVSEPAAAQRIVCPPGSASCFAIRFSFTHTLDQPLPTLFTVHLQNLQGSFTNTDALWFIDGLSIDRRNGESEHPPFVMRVAPSGVLAGTPEGAIARSPLYAGLAEGSYIGDEYATRRWYNGVPGEIVGCRASFRTPDEWGFRTCPRLGLDGWARYDFRLGIVDSRQLPTTRPTRLVDFEEFTFGVTTTDGSCYFGGSARVGKIVAPACTSHPYLLPTTTVASGDAVAPEALVTPEPATVALLASGLGALGSLRLARRRRARQR